MKKHARLALSLHAETVRQLTGVTLGSVVGARAPLPDTTVCTLDCSPGGGGGAGFTDLCFTLSCTLANGCTPY